jgi:hypothetical protein
MNLARIAMLLAAAAAIILAADIDGTWKGTFTTPTDRRAKIR